MTPEQARAMYRRAIDQFETVTFRRYTGTSETKTDYAVTARVTDFAASELIGPIVQGDRKVIVMHEDLVAASYPLPITTGANSKIVVSGKELQVKAVDGNTRRVGGETIAYEIAAGG